MIDASEITVRSVGTIFTVLGYIAFFWRIFKSNPGKRLVECGSMTLIVAFAFLALASLSLPGKVPDWLFLSWLMLVFLLCLSTLFFVAQRIYQAIRRHRT